MGKSWIDKFKSSKTGDITFDPNDDHYKTKSPEITNTDAYLTAPIVAALEKAEGRSLENDELRKIVKNMAEKNPNATPEEFKKMLLNYKSESNDETADEFNQEENKSFDQINAKRMGKHQPKSEETTKSYKSADRKDKYGNPLVSDDAFKVGQKAAKEYLEESLKYNDLDSLKKSNVFLGYMQDKISDALEQAGLNPDYDLTYQDLNEIIGSVIGEEINFEDYEGNAAKGWTGKKYSGYDPSKINEHEKKFNDLGPVYVKDNDRKKLTKAGFTLDDTYSGGDTYEIYDKDTGRNNSISLSANGKYYYTTINGTVYYYEDLDTAIDRATYKSGKAPSNGAIGWENDSYDSARAEKKLKELRGY